MTSEPRRTCLGCRQVRPQVELIRFARAADGRVHPDPGHRVAGRGAYACPVVSCLDRALTRAQLTRAFRRASEPPPLSAAAIVESWTRR